MDKEPEHKVIYVSPAYETIWERSVESLYKNPDDWLDAIHPDDRLRVGAVFLAKAETGDMTRPTPAARSSQPLVGPP